MSKMNANNITEVLGVIPARGGSKGIVDKNIRELFNIPLIGWAAKALMGADTVTRKICNTDSQKIADVALKYGLEIPWLRPAYLATDDTLIVDVLSHLLNKLADEESKHYQYIALVQTTSPTVTSADIDAAVKIAIDNNADTVITGVNVGHKHHPSTMYTIDDDGRVQWYESMQNRMSRRQDLPSVYVRSGLVYVIKSELIVKQKTIYGDRIFSHLITEDKAINIDEEFDLRLAEFLMSNQY